MSYNEIAPKFRSRKAYIQEWKKAAEMLTSRGEYSDFEAIISVYSLTGGGIDDYIKIMNRLSRLSLADLRYFFALSLADGEIYSEKIDFSLKKYFLSAQMHFYNFQP